MDLLEESILKAAKRFHIKIREPDFLLLPEKSYFSNKKLAKDFVRRFDEQEVEEGDTPDMILFFVKPHIGDLLYNSVKQYYLNKNVNT